jgi:pyruvate carboxylase subunit B
MPPEALEINPLITLSPMPGGALTANTQMMRDNNCLDLYPKVIQEMREVVERGGFGTSVTPVSQFYFQQAFANVTQGKWNKITDGYGKMVLGYFGKTPSEPDEEIVKLASEQLGLEPTKEDVHDINDRNPELGIDAATKKLEDAGLPVNDENIFITATCADKGIEFLKGNKTLGIRYKEDETKKTAPATKTSATPKDTGKEGPASYVVNVDGKTFNVNVAPSGMTVAPATPPQQATSASPGKEYEISAPMPGTIVRILVESGDQISSGETVMVLEAMKMETEVKSDKSGKVLNILVDQGQAVTSGEAILVIEE